MALRIEHDEPDVHPWEDDDQQWVYSWFSYRGSMTRDKVAVAYANSEDPYYIYEADKGFVIKVELANEKSTGVMQDKKVAGPFDTLDDAKAYYTLVLLEEPR